MANCLGKFFSSIVNNSTSSNHYPHQTSNSSIDTVFLSLDVVLQYIKALKRNGSPGPENIHPIFIRKCSTNLAYPLLLLFKLSISEGKLPSAWKHALITPLYKGGLHSDPSNYRPISITSNIGKILERIVTDYMMQYCLNNNIISKDQYGFVPGKSTCHQLVFVYDQIISWYDEGCVIDVVYFDLQKAFDSIPHVILIEKLECLGFGGEFLRWVQDFLNERSMSVTITDAKSLIHFLKWGVPQGTIPAPLLFIIFINNLLFDLLCEKVIFADDLKVYLKIAVRDKTSIMALQTAINIISDRISSWGLKFSIHKCAVLRFGRNSSSLPVPLYLLHNEPIPVKSSIKDLGVIVDTDLRFHNHVKTVAQKAGGLASNLLRTVSCRDPEFMKNLFCSHIRPIIEYYVYTTLMRGISIL